MTKQQKIISSLVVLVIIMFFFSYALVPIYNVMCKVLGIGGKTNPNAVANTSVIDKSRTVTVHFLATNNANLPWEFWPNIKKVDLHPGQSIRVSYHAKNLTDHTMTVQAIPSVTPGLAASHLKKTECFCFRQQTLKAKASMDMPIVFHLDNTLPKNMHEVTLSYTLFEATQKPVDKPKGKLG